MKRMENMEDNLKVVEKKILLQFERFIETNTFRQEVERIRSLLNSQLTDRANRERFKIFK